MPLSLLIRRLHLYLAMLCLPWIVMYGASSIAFNHPGLFPRAPNVFDTSGAEWTLVGSWTPGVVVPEGDVPSGVVAELVATAGLDAKVYGAYRIDPSTLQVSIQDFWTNHRLTYHQDDRRLEYHTAPKYPHQILVEMHAKAGYRADSPLDTVWAAMVDVVAVGFVLWVVTGLYMWWQLPRMRLWGALALGAGAASFAGLMLLL